jgi:dimethylargininase
MPERIALTREISAAIARCELTHLARQPIDLAEARRQHDRYVQTLASLGCSAVRLPAGEGMPDSLFVEDIAIVFDELAMITRPGAASRRGETPAVAAALGPYRLLRKIEPPATIDGGDVLVAGKRVFIGVSARTNLAAMTQMVRHLEPFGYHVYPVPVVGCLHLKSAVTAITDGTLLINPEWVPAESFRRFDLLVVDPAEPYAANALRIGNDLIYPTTFPRTRARLAARGLSVVDVEVSELAKAEGAVTCCSLVFTAS